MSEKSIEREAGTWFKHIRCKSLSVEGADCQERIRLAVNDHDDARIELLDSCGHTQLCIIAFSAGGVSMTFRCPPREKYGVDYVLGFNTDRDGHASISLHGNQDARKQALLLTCDCDGDGAPAIKIHDSEGAEVFSTKEGGAV